MLKCKVSAGQRRSEEGADSDRDSDTDRIFNECLSWSSAGRIIQSLSRDASKNGEMSTAPVLSSVQEMWREGIETTLISPSDI